MKYLIEELSYQLLDHIQISTHHLQIYGQGLGRELSDYIAKEIYRKLTEEYGYNLNEVKAATIDRIIVGDVEDSYSYPLGYSVKSDKLRIYLNVEYIVSRFFVFWRTYETTVEVVIDDNALDSVAKQKEYLGNVVHTTLYRKDVQYEL